VGSIPTGGLKVKEILNIPEDVQVVALLPLGYALTIPRPVPRKSFNEIVMREKWRS
jgi:nitroreductase